MAEYRPIVRASLMRARGIAPWFRAHLADKHPEVKLSRRSRSGRGWKKSSEADRAEAMVAVEARKAMLA